MRCWLTSASTWSAAAWSSVPQSLPGVQSPTTPRRRGVRLSDRGGEDEQREQRRDGPSPSGAQAGGVFTRFPLTAEVGPRLLTPSTSTGGRRAFTPGARLRRAASPTRLSSRSACSASSVSCVAQTTAAPCSSAARRSRLATVERVGLVEPGGRLVGEDDARRARERAGDGDALALAGREARGREAQPVAEPDRLERGRGALGRLVGGSCFSASASSTFSIARQERRRAPSAGRRRRGARGGTRRARRGRARRAASRARRPRPRRAP